MKLKKFGALTKKENMFSWRPWELRSEFIVDIVSCEGNKLVINTGVGIIQVLPRIVNYKSFRWISDQTRFYYGSLFYGINKINQKLNRKNILKFEKLNVIANLANIKNLQNSFRDDISTKTKFSVLGKYLPIFKTFGLDYLPSVISSRITLSDYLGFFYDSVNIGKKFNIVKNNFNILSSQLSEGLPKVTIMKNIPVGLTKLAISIRQFSKSSSLVHKFVRKKFSGSVFNLQNIINYSDLSGFFPNIGAKSHLANHLESNFLLKILKPFSNFLVTNVRDKMSLVLNHNLSTFFQPNLNISWFKIENILISYDLTVSGVFMGYTTSEVVKDQSIYILLYTTKYSSIFFNFCFIIPTNSYLETGGNFWDVTGKLQRSFPLSKFIGFERFDWFSGYKVDENKFTANLYLSGNIV